MAPFYYRTEDLNSFFVVLQDESRDVDVDVIEDHSIAIIDDTTPDISIEVSRC